MRGWLPGFWHAALGIVRRALFVGQIFLVPLAAQAQVQTQPCRSEPDSALVAAALRSMARNVDPCGESAEVLAVLDAFRNCTQAIYHICTDSTASRNFFDRPSGPHSESLTRAITWNPELRSELEPQCDGDPDTPVRRDPVASLLHELVHAVQDCQGLNPGEHELAAVRIENIYRRGAGLCQRRGYGENSLPLSFIRTCGPDGCPCSVPGEPVDPRQQVARSTSDSKPTTASGDGELLDSDPAK